MASDLFVDVVLISDECLQPKSASWRLFPERESFIRFFKIASVLPMDVQMLLCNRVYQLAGDGMAYNNRVLAVNHVVAKWS
jgi:hypothetical protein